MKSRPTAPRPPSQTGEHRQLGEHQGDHNDPHATFDWNKSSETFGYIGHFGQNASEEEYRVGPGRPPKEYQFKPGQSGNPKGARRKTRPITPDLKALLERALSETVTLRQGEKDRIVTKAAAGIEQLVNQYAKGDRYARRDLIDLANKLGVDLVAGQAKKIEEAMQGGCYGD